MSRLLGKDIEKTLKKAGISYSVSEYEKITLLGSFFISVFFSSYVYIVILRFNANIAIIFTFIISWIISMFILRNIPVILISKRKRLLERDLLYSTRHLILKLESGSSLLNSLESVSNLRNKSSLFFKEIITDVYLGMPLEKAIEKAIEHSPSKAYSMILEEINNSMKTGSDLVKTLKEITKDITRRHLILIKEYGRKLNPLSMFYMIFGTVVPSLGTALLVIIAGILPTIIVDRRVFLFSLIVLIMTQLFFVMLFRSLKPTVIE